MAFHNVLRFAVPAPALAGRRLRARPADIIPLRLRRSGRRPGRSSALFAIAAVLLWAAAVVLGLLAFRTNREWMGDLASGWSGWPTW
jgi:hypothetical protein